MFDLNSGWLFGDTLLWRTQNGGVTWKKLSFPSLRVADFARGRFVTQRLGWILSTVSQKLYKTYDGGLHWTAEPLPKFDGIIETAWLSTDLNRVWLGGGQYHSSTGPDGPNWAVKKYESGSRGILQPTVITRNIAQTVWKKQQVPNSSFSIFGLQFWGLGKGFAWGDNRALYHTETGGEVWKVAEFHNPVPPEDEDQDGIPTVFYQGHEQGWISTRNHLFHTTDGGQNWYPISVKGTPYFDVFAFPNNRHGLGIARNSELYESFDGGHMWKQVPLSFIPRSLYFLDHHTG